MATCSLASVTVFSGLDPDKLSNGLMWFGCPERLSFSISYAYRVLPMLMEEFQNILLSFRLRGKSLPGKGIIPSHDHHIVIGLVGSVIKICAPVSSALLRQIQGALNASRLINGTLDGVIVLFSQKLHRLDMAHWRKPLRGNMVPVRIIGLRCRPLPA